MCDVSEGVGVDGLEGFSSSFSFSFFLRVSSFFFASFTLSFVQEQTWQFAEKMGKFIVKLLHQLSLMWLK